MEAFQKGWWQPSVRKSNRRNRTESTKDPCVGCHSHTLFCCTTQREKPFFSLQFYLPPTLLILFSSPDQQPCSKSDVPTQLCVEELWRPQAWAVRLALPLPGSWDPSLQLPHSQKDPCPVAPHGDELGNKQWFARNSLRVWQGGDPTQRRSYQWTSDLGIHGRDKTSSSRILEKGDSCRGKGS